MAAHPRRRKGINMTTDVRRSYVGWSIEGSGLAPAQVSEVTTGIWSDRLVDGTHGSLGAPAPSEGALSQQTPALPGFVFRSATGSQASNVAGDP